MGVGTSLFLIAVGAILDFAVTVSNKSFNINKIGLILMIVGIIGLVLSLIFWRSWGGVGTGYHRGDRGRRDGNGTSIDQDRRY